MNTNKHFQFLLSGFILLLILNLITFFFIFRPQNYNNIKALEKIQLRLDSVSLRLETSHQRVDSVLTNINKSLELTRQLDEEVIDLSTGYEKDHTLARKKLEILKEQIRIENQKLISLQNELKKL